MLTKEQAVEKLSETRDSYQEPRRAFDSFWTLAIAFDSGQQWTYPTTEYGRIVMRKLREVVDPKREDVRVTMNTIHGDVVQVRSALQPHRIVSKCHAASGAIRDQNVASMADRLLLRLLPQTNGLNILREKEDIRPVLGTAIVRRTMSAKATAAKVVKDEEKGDRTIKDYRYGWDHVYPWEIIRDPSATTCTPSRTEAEEVFAQCKPRSLLWLKKNFGVDIQTETTLGGLLDYQKQVYSAHGIGGGGATTSQILAVNVYEAYFRDADDENDWSWMLLGYSDPAKDGNVIIPIRFVKNPFHGLPFHVFTYDRYVQCPWGVGVPHLEMQGQSITNIAWTWLLRVMQAGAGKWAYEEGTVENPGTMLNNRIDQPLIWKRNPNYPNVSAAPTRVTIGQINPAVLEVINGIPAYNQRAVNIGDVQRGIVSKRGESGQAIEARLGEANKPLDQVRRDDHLTYQELLYGTLLDVTHPDRFRLDNARKLLGDDVPEEMILSMLRKPVKETVRGVEIIAALTNPKTPGEIQDNTIRLTESQILTAEEAQWVMIEEGMNVNPAKADSYRRQQMELDTLIAGGEAMPAITDDHLSHLYTIKRFADSPRFHAIEPDARDRIYEHWASHKQQMAQDALDDQALAMGQGQQGQGGGMPSPPASDNATQVPSGTVGPAMNVG